MICEMDTVCPLNVYDTSAMIRIFTDNGEKTFMIRLLAYDIEDNKRRHKIVMELGGEARRMQYSVFKVF